MASVTNEAVAAYLPMIERLAGAYYKRDYRIESDDLIQEAWEKVWLALERGLVPTKQLMLNAMNDWASHVTRGVNSEPVGLSVQETASQ